MPDEENPTTGPTRRFVPCCGYSALHRFAFSLLVVTLTLLSLRDVHYSNKRTSADFSDSTERLDLQRELDDILLAKLGRYELFEQRTQGSGQPAGAWYQDNAEPIYTCLNAERIGPHGEGGKWMCDPQKFRAGAPCLIYSIGSQDDFRWEKAILDDVNENCEIHVFDHTVREPKTKPEQVHYHTWGLASTQKAGNDMKTLHAIVRELNHENRVIDVFKIDCEGCEWETFREWFEANVTIDEILVEVHTGTMQPANNPPAKDFMSFMKDRNMLIHHKEPNVKYSGFDGLCVEFALVRFSTIRRSFVKDSSPRDSHSTASSPRMPQYPPSVSPSGLPSERATTLDNVTNE